MRLTKFSPKENMQSFKCVSGWQLMHADAEAYREVHFHCHCHIEHFHAASMRNLNFCDVYVGRILALVFGSLGSLAPLVTLASMATISNSSGISLTPFFFCVSLVILLIVAITTIYSGASGASGAGGTSLGAFFSLKDELLLLELDGRLEELARLVNLTLQKEALAHVCEHADHQRVHLAQEIVQVLQRVEQEFLHSVHLVQLAQHTALQLRVRWTGW